MIGVAARVGASRLHAVRVFKRLAVCLSVMSLWGYIHYHTGVILQVPAEYRCGG